MMIKKKNKEINKLEYKKLAHIILYPFLMNEAKEAGYFTCELRPNIKSKDLIKYKTHSINKVKLAKTIRDEIIKAISSKAFLTSLYDVCEEELDNLKG